MHVREAWRWSWRLESKVDVTVTRFPFSVKSTTMESHHFEILNLPYPIPLVIKMWIYIYYSDIIFSPSRNCGGVIFSLQCVCECVSVCVSVYQLTEFQPWFKVNVYNNVANLQFKLMIKSIKNWWIRGMWKLDSLCLAKASRKLKTSWDISRGWLQYPFLYLLLDRPYK